MANADLIQHDTSVKGGQFFVVEDGKHVGELDYRLGGDGVVAFHRTFVDDSQRGKGVAGKLVREGLAWVRAEGLKFSPECSYVEHYAKKHPEVGDLLA